MFRWYLQKWERDGTLRVLAFFAGLTLCFVAALLLFIPTPLALFAIVPFLFGMVCFAYSMSLYLSGN